MKKDLIASLIDGEYLDPTDGKAVQVPIKSIVISDRFAGIEADLIDRLDFGRKITVVSDRNTEIVSGTRIKHALASTRRLSSIILDADVKPQLDVIDYITQEAWSSDAIIAVGSGTINDICKYSAFRLHKPFAVFATAPSMNGYTSENAAITIDGLKRSMSAKAPEGVFVDLRVMASAPPRLILAGLGDSLCRSTAQADWLLAHLLLDQNYHELPFLLLAGEEEELFSEPEALTAGDTSAVNRLARVLILSGIGMTICGSSHPASQGEHLISHFVEMFGPSSMPDSYHGEQIGVTTLIMAKLQEASLSLNKPGFYINREQKKDFVQRYGRETGSNCWSEFSKKRLTRQRAGMLNSRLAKDWDRIRERIYTVTKSVELLEAVLRRAGAPILPQDLGWSQSFFYRAVNQSREIRNRYTFLDFIQDCNLDISKIFGD